ncbi:MAG: glycogen/starch synthase [Patescibacteria group bacterium]|nr:glycogen/starch synthase [Patescibacteria group bacterium]MDD5172738.1 glycogen/starch synthase [Patescibacteria group bacterium]
MRALKIVHVSSEISPYSKSGGLADVTRSLPRALKRLGHQVMAITPYYGFIKEDKWTVENLNIHLSLNFDGQEYKFGFKKAICPDKYPVFFICQQRLFGSRHKRGSEMYNYPDNGLRFLLFNLAAIELIKNLKFEPQVIHCHDWHTGLIPNYLKIKYKKEEKFKNVATLFTIHNLLFQGPKDWWKIPINKKDNGRNLPPENLKKTEWINFVKRAVLNADIINTVSLRYAQEIMTEEYGCQMEKHFKKREKDIYGIINGIDYAIFNPQFDPNIYVHYDINVLEKKIENKLIFQKKYNLEVNAKIPIIGLANRLTEQKGFELIINLLDHLLKKDLQIVVVGSGGGKYREILRKSQKAFPKKLLFISPFREDIARKIYAASDIYLMPSRFEPCGISQLISLRYGSIPIVHAVGGLLDTVSDYNSATGRGNGFVFRSYNSYDLLFAIARALENHKREAAWRNLVRRSMKESYSWTLPAKKYVVLYRKAIKKMRTKNEKAKTIKEK